MKRIVEFIQCHSKRGVEVEETTLTRCASKIAENWYEHWKEYVGYQEITKIVHCRNDNELEAAKKTVEKLNEMILEELKNIDNEADPYQSKRRI